MAFQQGQQGQQQMQGQPQQQSNPNDPWGTSSGGSGPAEYVLTVQKCEPGSAQQDPTKQVLTWTGVTHLGANVKKSWGIGKDWVFDWNQMPPRYADPKNATRQVNENSTFGVLLRCILGNGPFDLTAAKPILQQRPGGPLSPGVWMGTVWHMCRVVLDFGQGPREVPWPIAFLGVQGGQVMQPQWKDPAAAMGTGQQGFSANPPAPQNQNMQAQNMQQQPQYQQQQQQPMQQQPMQQFQQQPYQQQPQQNYQQPQQQQYSQQQNGGYQQQPQQQQFQQQQPQNQQYANMPPGGYGTGVHPSYQNQQPQQQYGQPGGGPAAGGQFHG